MCGRSSEVHKAAGWYFWDDVYYYHGPFSSKEEAEEALKKYIEGVVKAEAL